MIVNLLCINREKMINIKFQDDIIKVMNAEKNDIELINVIVNDINEIMTA